MAWAKLITHSAKKQEITKKMGLSAFLTPHPESDTIKKYALTKNSMNAAKNQKPLQLEIGESVEVSQKPASGIQLEIAGIVDKYATAVADVQKETVGEIGKFTRAVALAGSLAATPAGMAAESPYEPVAANGKTELVLKEEPSQNADIKKIMERYKQTAEFEKIPSMPTEQRRKLMEYYKKAKEA